MAKKPSPSMQAFIDAHVNKPALDKTEHSLTVYVSGLELQRIEDMKTRLSLTRQAVLRQLLVSGLEQFNEVAKWWK